MKKVNLSLPRASSYTFINRQLFLLVNVGGSWALNAFSIVYTSEIQKSEFTLCYSRLIFINSDHCHFILWLVDQENPHFAILHYLVLCSGYGDAETVSALSSKCACIYHKTLVPPRNLHCRTTAQGSFWTC